MKNLKKSIMRMGATNLSILIDADVISHFIVAGEITSLPNIFDNKLLLLDKVYDELKRFPGRRKTVENLIDFRLLELMPFPENDLTIKKEYFYIKNKLFKGDGESACMAVARYNKNILASSNLRDIKGYCSMHKIPYLTTMDFLCEALRKEIFDNDRCCSFVKKVIQANSKLPVTDFNKWQCVAVSI